MNGLIFFVEQNVRGAWVVYGLCGIKQYYGYTRKQAIEQYKADCDIFENQKEKPNGVSILRQPHGG